MGQLFESRYVIVIKLQITNHGKKEDNIAQQNLQFFPCQNESTNACISRWSDPVRHLFFVDHPQPLELDNGREETCSDGIPFV